MALSAEPCIKVNSALSLFGIASDNFTLQLYRHGKISEFETTDGGGTWFKRTELLSHYEDLCGTLKAMYGPVITLSETGTVRSPPKSGIKIYGDIFSHFSIILGNDSKGITRYVTHDEGLTWTEDHLQGNPERIHSGYHMIDLTTSGLPGDPTLEFSDTDE